MTNANLSAFAALTAVVAMDNHLRALRKRGVYNLDFANAEAFFELVFFAAFACGPYSEPACKAYGLAAGYAS